MIADLHRKSLRLNRQTVRFGRRSDKYKAVCRTVAGCNGDRCGTFTHSQNVTVFIHLRNGIIRRTPLRWCGAFRRNGRLQLHALADCQFRIIAIERNAYRRLIRRCARRKRRKRQYSGKKQRRKNLSFSHYRILRSAQRDVIVLIVNTLIIPQARRGCQANIIRRRLRAAVNTAVSAAPPLIPHPHSPRNRHGAPRRPAQFSQEARPSRRPRRPRRR